MKTDFGPASFWGLRQNLYNSLCL